VGPRRARLWLRASAIAAFLPVLGVPLRHWLDFAAFYAGGQLATHGALLNPIAVVLLQFSEGLPPTPFVSPPFVAILYAPLAGLPYDLAALVQLGVMVAALVGGAALWSDALGIPRRWGVLGALAWGPAGASVASGQIDTLALLLSGAAVRLLGSTGGSAGWSAQGRGRRGRRAEAGILVGLLAFKPQLTFGAGIGLLRRLGRPGIVTLLVTGALLYGLSAVAVGVDAVWPLRWIAALQAYSTADFAANGWQASSPLSLGLRASLAFGSPIPVAIGGIVALGVAAYALRGWAPASVALDVALWSALGLVLSPHAWVYDATLLLPALGAWAALAGRSGWPALERLLLTLTFAGAALWPIGGVLGISAVPLIVVGVPLRLAILARRVALPADAAGLLGDSGAAEAIGIFATTEPT
jgi:hypothetical protein